MKLSIGTLAHDRRFGKRVRRAAQRASRLREWMAEVPTLPDGPTAILVTVTDDLPPGRIREEADTGKLYQVMVGLTPDATEDELFHEIVSAVARAIELAPLDTGDRARMLAVVARGDSEP